MSPHRRRGPAVVGAGLATAATAVLLTLGTAGAANAAPSKPPCSMSSYCVRPTPEFNREAADCAAQAGIGAGFGAAAGGPPGALTGAGAGATNCVYQKVKPKH